MISYEYRQFLNQKILEYLPAKKWHIGDKWNFQCPLCGDGKSGHKHRGWWYEKSASYFCFNCSTGMSGIKFLETLSGNDYADIKKEFIRLFLKTGQRGQLSASFERPVSEPNIFQLKSIVDAKWKKQLSPDAVSYLNGRKLLDAPFLKDPLYSCYCKNNSEYILIPWVINGVDAYYQLNDYKKHGSIKYIFPKDRKKLIYGLDNIDLSWKYIIVFEGVYDSLFVKNAVAVGTKSITEYQLKLIRERYPNHKICISFDNDKPGIEAMVKLIKNGSNVTYFKWFAKNTQQKDVNDFIKSQGDVNVFSSPSKLEKMILTPLQMKLWLIQNDMWISV